MAGQRDVPALDVSALGHLKTRVEGGLVTFTLVRPEGIEHGLPPSFELRLGPELQALVDRGAEVVLDMENIAGVGSRQLGVMLALYRALRSRHPRLRLLNAHENVRRLLALSRTSQFFEIGPDDRRPE
ncbi:MAG: STAS domain-containing protein [Phycisphaerae bacterium]|nr:STAS domain-containing protein [Phycisphaerae bacterium]MCZ2398721.1 STAS domain-containing protein [Phycisphaerae bacterium]NUQ49651.1 STAS domain-containing protein [Phycisphaerae bacterium]